jgi:hypothetical protein
MDHTISQVNSIEIPLSLLSHSFNSSSSLISVIISTNHNLYIVLVSAKNEGSLEKRLYVLLSVFDLTDKI